MFPKLSKNSEGDFSEADINDESAHSIFFLLRTLQSNKGFNYLGYNEKPKDNKNQFQRWGLNRNDDIGMSSIKNEYGQVAEETQRSGALIELRKLGNDIKPENLTEFAFAVFDLTVLINKVADPEEPSRNDMLYFS